MALGRMVTNERILFSSFRDRAKLEKSHLNIYYFCEKHGFSTTGENSF
jgi:hypothetical protein